MVTGFQEGQVFGSFSDLPKSADFDAQYYSPVESWGIPCHIAQTESQFTVSTNFTGPFLKNTGNALSASKVNLEVICCSGFIQYRSYARSLLILLKQADLIYPFHDFW
ncbi:hypothetical protein [Rufibacter roseus]|uniref:hypothetical protein n=1 Tax=Rufibacter roseus TaxID=1567108 RepID=UPI00128FF999|nr:hypothetical protein [Rufibacter roseus]